MLVTDLNLNLKKEQCLGVPGERSQVWAPVVQGCPETSWNKGLVFGKDGGRDSDLKVICIRGFYFFNELLLILLFAL